MKPGRRTNPFFAFLIPLALLAAGCGGGSGGKVVIVDDGPIHDPNPGTALVGLWTGTFTDGYGDYTASLELDADSVVPVGDPGRALIVWGEESLGLEMSDGDLLELGPGRWDFVYDAVDPLDGSYRDTVSGELTLVANGLLEGTFETSSGTSGEISFRRNAPVTQSEMAGHYEMVFSDSSSRDVFYLGEVEIDVFGNVIPGSLSYLTDDVDGALDPDANLWPIRDGLAGLVDPATGWFEGYLEFDYAEDTIFFSGYLGTDLYVFGGTFEDAIGTGLITFLPID